MKTARLLTGLAVALSLAGTAGAQTYTFNVEYSGAGAAALAAGSDNPIGTAIMPGDSFLWTIQAMGGAYWNVNTTGSFFPFMAFGVSESGARTGDYTLTLLRNGVSVYSFSEIGSTQRFVHVGTNTIDLTAGLDFDVMKLDYSLTSALEDDLNNPPPFPGVVSTTPTGLLPIFGPPENDSRITYVGSAATTTPEPATYALMATGLGMIGLVARRRKSSV